MKVLQITTYLLLTQLLFLSFQGLSQSRRILGVIPMHNEGSSSYKWVDRGIKELVANNLSTIGPVAVFEGASLDRVLKRLDVGTSSDVDGRKAFSIGKATGIEVLFLGDYRVDNRKLFANFKLVSTFTGSPILTKSYEVNLEDLFNITQEFIKEGLDVMQVNLDPEEKQELFRRPTNSIEAYEAYCKAYLEMDKESPAEIVAGYFQRALQLDAQFWEAQFSLGVIYSNARLYNQAHQQFNSIIEKNGQLYKPYFGKGVIYFQEKEYHKSLPEFKTSTNLNPEHDRSYYYMGVAYTRLDSIKKGIQVLEKSIELNPNYAPAYYQLGLAEMKRGWFKKAVTVLSKATTLDPDYYLANNALGEAYYALNLYEEAIIEFNKAIKQKPGFATAYFNLGNSVYRQGAIAEIVDAFWSLLEGQYIIEGTNGFSESPLSGLEELREKSRITDANEIHSDMVHAYRTALKYDHTFYEASYNLALTYEKMDNADSSEFFYKMSIAQKPDLAQAHMRLGKLYDRQKKYDLALKEFREVVKIAPEFFAGNPKLGEPYRYINIIEDVLKENQKKSELDPTDKEALRIIGKIYYSLGRYGQAEQYFQQLVELSPNDVIAQQTLQQIRRHLRKL